MPIENNVLILSGGIQHRGGTMAALAAVNPLPLAREIMVEFDTGKLKIGDGVRYWNELPYAAGIGGGTPAEPVDPVIDDEDDDFMKIHNAGAHNAHYRGNLLTFNSALSAVIQAGTFGDNNVDVYPGDYFEFNNVAYTYDGNSYTYSGIMRVVDCNGYINTRTGMDDGTPDFTTNHIIVVPDACLYNANMNDTDDNSTGYGNSKMKTTNLKRAEAIFKACFGADHVIVRGERMPTNYNGTEIESKTNRLVDLMDEAQVYGYRVFSNEQTPFWPSFRQFAAFRYNPELVRIGERYYLRNTAEEGTFCSVSQGGYSTRNAPSDVKGVRPFGLIN